MVIQFFRVVADRLPYWSCRTPSPTALMTLKILFETSYNLGQLPAEWKIGNITAIFKKGNKSDHLIIDLSV